MSLQFYGYRPKTGQRGAIEIVLITKTSSNHRSTSEPTGETFLSVREAESVVGSRNAAIAKARRS